MQDFAPTIEEIFPILQSLYDRNQYDSYNYTHDIAKYFHYYSFLRKSGLENIALDRLKEFYEWQQSINFRIKYPRCHSSELPNAILCCNQAEIFKHIPECQYGYDKEDKPVVYYLFTCHNTHEALKLTSLSRLLEYQIWQNEVINERLYAQSVLKKRLITSATLVMDVLGLEMTALTTEFLHVLQKRAEIFAQFYPFLFDRIMILNAPPDAHAISYFKQFCQQISSPLCTVHVTTTVEVSRQLLRDYINAENLPIEYGGHDVSLVALTHPFHVDDFTMVEKPFHTASSMMSSSSFHDELSSPRPYSTTDGGSGPSHRHQSSSGRAGRVSLSSASSTHAEIFAPFGGGNKADYLLSNLTMTPVTRALLAIFVNSLGGNNIPKTPQFIDMGWVTADDRTATSEEGSDYALSQPYAPINTTLFSSNLNVNLDATVSVTLKPKIFSVLLDSILHISVGDDRLALKTNGGAVVLKVEASKGNTPNNHSTRTVTESSSNFSIYQNFKKQITYKKYYGNFVLSHGRLYRISRGAYLSGYLQKWPMSSQSFGNYTNRYFILEDNMLRYWKAPPGSEAEYNQARGSFLLTASTTVTRAKTLFGSSTLIVKSESDTITLCAYNTPDDIAWFNEIHHAIQRVKILATEKSNDKSQAPEIVWCQPDPSCKAVAADILDVSVERDIGKDTHGHSNPKAFTNPSGTSSGLLSFIHYVILCRINTGLSALHSVQIGSDEHAQIRLENSELDLGVKLSCIRICGDNIIVGGSNGFVGAGKIPEWHSAMLHQKHSLSSAARYVYIRRVQNCSHALDSIIQVIATPRLIVKNPSSTTSSHGHADDIDVSMDWKSNHKRPNVMASGDDIGCVCIWMAEGSTETTPHALAVSNAAKLSWRLVHTVFLGHRIISINFSPDSQFMSVITPERAVLFDVSGLVKKSDIPRTIAPISSVVIDDCVGFNTNEVYFAIDLSIPHKLKFWKVAQGTEAATASMVGTHVDMSNELESTTTGDTYENEYEDGDRILPDQSVNADKVMYTEMHIGTLFSRDRTKLSICNLFAQHQLKPKPKILEQVVMSPVNSPAVSQLRPRLTVKSTSSSELSDEEKDGAENVDVNFDPYFFSESYVVSALRAHFRDWWCDYQSRFMLLEQAHIISVCKLESSLIGTSQLTSSTSAGSKKRKSKAISKFDIRTSNMFWSTLWSALGKRVVSRYCFSRADISTSATAQENKVAIAVHFVMTLACGLYDALGDEYMLALVSSWKSAAQDMSRDLLENQAAQWFRDVNIFGEFQRRLQLAPDLTISFLTDVLASVERAISHYEVESRKLDSTSNSELKNHVENSINERDLLNAISGLKQQLIVVSDQQGMTHAVPSAVSVYLKHGVNPDLSTQNQVYNPMNLMKWLVINPLCHMERSEPFAVVLVIMGLTSFPPYILRNCSQQIVNNTANLVNIPPLPDTEQECEAKLVKSFSFKGDNAESKPSANDAGTSGNAWTAGSKGTGSGVEGMVDIGFDDYSIDELISYLAQETPPWIRLILGAGQDHL